MIDKKTTKLIQESQMAGGKPVVYLKTWLSS